MILSRVIPTDPAESSWC